VAFSLLTLFMNSTSCLIILVIVVNSFSSINCYRVIVIFVSLVSLIGEATLSLIFDKYVLMEAVIQ
jgi:hypothetical protein